MFRCLNTTMSRRLMGLALAGALAFSVASFALPDKTYAAEGSTSCPPDLASQIGNLDATNVNASLETTSVDGRTVLGDVRIDETGGNFSLETGGENLRASFEGIPTETSCREQ